MMTTATRTEQPTEARDRLGVRLEQLGALLAVAHGAGGESFRRFSEKTQDDYLSLCSDIAYECSELARSPDAA